MRKLPKEVKQHGDEPMHNHNLNGGLDTSLFQMLQLKHHCHYGYVKLHRHHNIYGEYMIFVNEEDLPIREGQEVSFRIKSIPLTVSAYVQIDIHVAYDILPGHDESDGRLEGEIVQE